MAEGVGSQSQVGGLSCPSKKTSQNPDLAGAVGGGLLKRGQTCASCCPGTRHGKTRAREGVVFFLRDLKSGLESRLQMIIKVVPGALEPERQLSRWHTAHPTTHLHV